MQFIQNCTYLLLFFNDFIVSVLLSTNLKRANMTYIMYFKIKIVAFKKKKMGRCPEMTCAPSFLLCEIIIRLNLPWVGVGRLSRSLHEIESCFFADALFNCKIHIYVPSIRFQYVFIKTHFVVIYKFKHNFILFILLWIQIKRTREIVAKNQQLTIKTLLLVFY